MENFYFGDYFTFKFLKILKYFHDNHHISFIMDGNRRYAKRLNLNSTNSGHIAGTKTFKKFMNYSILSKLDEVTVWAFSIENFKRSNEEVNFLMDLAERQLEQISFR